MSAQASGAAKARYTITPLQAGQRTVAIIATGRAAGRPVHGETAHGIADHRAILVTADGRDR